MKLNYNDKKYRKIFTKSLDILIKSRWSKMVIEDGYNGFLAKNGLYKQWDFIYKKNKAFTRKEIKINFIS